MGNETSARNDDLDILDIYELFEKSGRKKFDDTLGQTDYSRQVAKSINQRSSRQLARDTQAQYHNSRQKISRVDSRYAEQMPRRLSGQDVGVRVDKQATIKHNRNNQKRAYKTSHKSPINLKQAKKLIATFGVAALIFAGTVTGISNYIQTAHTDKVVANSSVETIEQNGYDLNINPVVLAEYLQIKQDWDEIKNGVDMPTSDEILGIYDRLDAMGNSLLSEKLSKGFEDNDKFSFVSSEPEYNHYLNTNPNSEPVPEYRVFLTLHNNKSDKDKTYLVDKIGPVLLNYIKAEEAIDDGRGALYGLDSKTKTFSEKYSIAKDAISLLDKKIFPAYDQMTIHNYTFEKGFFDIDHSLKEHNPEKASKSSKTAETSAKLVDDDNSKEDDEIR